jgi:hypothetical protein
MKRLIVALPVTLLISNHALSQDASQRAWLSYSACVKERAAVYAQLEGSLRDLASAAEATCRDRRDALAKAIASSGAGAVTLTMQKLDEEIQSVALSTVAETRVFLKQSASGIKTP